MFSQGPDSAATYATIYPETIPDDKSVQSIGLNDVPDDIHHLILSELVHSSPATLPSVARSSKTLKDAAYPSLYRDLILCKPAGDDKDVSAYQALLDNFRAVGAKDIAKHVRSITVQNHIPDGDLALFIDKIAEFGALRQVK